MKSAFVQRAARKRANSLHTIPPAKSSQDYDRAYADIAASILFKQPCLSQNGLPIFTLNAAAFPDSYEIEYDSLLPYVLARLPDEDDLIAGTEYEVIFFAGGQPESATGEKKNGPGVSWYIQVYQVLSRALRKRLQKIYIVHERSWVRVLTEIFGAIVSPKFKRKVLHVNTLSSLALHIPIENLLIPPAVYLYDRKVIPDIYVPYATGARTFAAPEPFPKDQNGNLRLPRVLREATSFLLEGPNLDTEGIFRIPPSSTLLGVLKEAYDRGQRFIVWRELGVVHTDPGMDSEILAEIHESDAYGIHLAAGLIKTWYRELKQPVFSERCYDRIRQEYGSPDSDITLERLSNLLSPSSDSSILPLNSRRILVWHLLPLLSIVASHQASNKMTADNLAVCFSPALLCGSDQLQDAKMTSVLRKLIKEAVEHWTEGLDQACGTNQDDLHARLRNPPNAIDYEDPLIATYSKSTKDLMEEMREVDVLEEHQNFQAVPALPPRSTSLARNQSPSPNRARPSPPKRKPAPVVANLPRYSTLVPSPATSSSSPTASQHLDEKHRLVDEQNGFLPEKGPDPSKAASEKLQIPKPPEEPIDGSQVQSRNSIPSSPLLSPSLAEIQNVQLRSISGDSTKSIDDDVFIKPTWAASSRKGSASSALSHRKPTPPLTLNKSATDPVKSEGATASSSYAPRPRTPSPGLLQRMQSWEKEASQTNDTQRPGGGVGERKQSVDDLKRVYEERASTVATLARTKSNASVKSQS